VTCLRRNDGLSVQHALARDAIHNMNSSCLNLSSFDSAQDRYLVAADLSRLFAVRRIGVGKAALGLKVVEEDK